MTDSSKRDDEADEEGSTQSEGGSGPPSIEPEPISLREIEMILAPGKPPPPRPREGSQPDIPKPPPLPRARLASAPDLARPPRPPVKMHGGPASMPPDMGAMDLEAFAVLGASPMPPKVLERPRPRPPLKSHGDTTVKKLVEEDVRSRTKDVAIQAPPDSAHEDLRKLASKPPPAGKDVVDFDDILRMGNNALSGALSAPSLPVDIEGLARKEGAKVATPGAPKAPLKKKRTEPAPTDEEERDRKRSSAPPSRRKSRRPVDSGPGSSRPPRDEKSKSSVAPRTSVSKSTAPAPPAPEVKSRMPLYVGLAVAAGGALFFLLRSPGETPPAESTSRPDTTQTVAAPAVTTDPTVPPASTQASPPEPTAEPTAESNALPTAQPTGATALTGTVPPSTGTVPPSTTKPPIVVPTATAAATGEFDRSVANAALSAAVGRASGCKQPGDPSGVAKVQVTFAPSGRVTTANVAGPPFAGTPTGGCIARAFKASTIPPFAGPPMTVSKTVTIP